MEQEQGAFLRNPLSPFSLSGNELALLFSHLTNTSVLLTEGALSSMLPLSQWQLALRPPSVIWPSHRGPLTEEPSVLSGTESVLRGPLVISEKQKWSPWTMLMHDTSLKNT